MDAAIACYKKAIEIDPKHAMAHSNLGQREGQGPVGRGHRLLQKAIALDPKCATPTSTWALR